MCHAYVVYMNLIVERVNSRDGHTDITQLDSHVLDKQVFPLDHEHREHGWHSQRQCGIIIASCVGGSIVPPVTIIGSLGLDTVQPQAC